MIVAMEGNIMPDEGPRHAHETTDANVRHLIYFGVGLCLTVVVGLLLSRAVFHYLVVHQRLGPPASPFENNRMLPPGPRLQVAAPEDLAQYKARQNEILSSYGWVDQKAGIVRIPIERAMDILLQQGLPVRGAAVPKQGSPKKRS
jgi:hypothetical protein